MFAIDFRNACRTAHYEPRPIWMSDFLSRTLQPHAGRPGLAAQRSRPLNGAEVGNGARKAGRTSLCDAFVGLPRIVTRRWLSLLQ